MLRFAQATFHHLLHVPISSRTTFIGSSPTLFAAAATQKAAAIRRVKFILEVRDLWPESMVAVTGRSSTTTRALRVLADHLYHRADQIIVLAQKNADAIVECGVDRNRIHYIPNGVELSSFSSPEHGPPPPGFPEAQLVAIYAGAHGPANDLSALVDAADILQRRGETRVHVLLVGDGVEKAGLRERARVRGLRNITFMDPVPKSEIPRLFSRCDVGVLTLKDTPLFRSGVSPNKLFDYMAASLPVLTNVEGECGDVVRAAGCGWVVRPGSAEALAEALGAAVAHADATKMGKSGHDYVESHYARQIFSNDLQRLLDRS